MSGITVPVECLLLAMVANKKLLRQLEERKAMLFKSAALAERAVDNCEMALELVSKFRSRIVELEAMLKAKEAT